MNTFPQKKRGSEHRVAKPRTDFAALRESTGWSVPAEVRRVNGRWRAVRLDGKPRLEDKFLPVDSSSFPRR